MNQKVTPDVKKARRATLAIFLVNGILLSSWVPHIPLVQEKLGLSEGLLGLALLGMAIGAVGAMPLSAIWNQYLGSGKVTILSAIAFCIALPLLTIAPNFLSLILALTLFGACNGAMDIGMNAQAIAVEKHYSKPIMSSFHGLFSVGGLLGSGLGGLALAAGVSPNTHTLVTSVLMLIASLIIRPHFLPKEAEDIKPGSKFVLPSKAVLGLGALAFLVLVAEGSMADWSAVYLKNTLGTGAGMAAAGYAAFSLAMAIGRLTGDRFVAGIGPVTLTRVTSLIAAIGLGVALLVNHPIAAIIGFACVGLGLSNLIPVLFSAAGRTPNIAASTGIAAVATAGYFGFLAGPPVIGFIAELFSLPIALGVVVLAIGTVTLFAGLTRIKSS